jgi:ABC-type phosphate transport system substrate-binding protein
MVKVLNAAGKATLPTAAAVTETLSKSPISADNVVTVDPLTKSPGAYPITAVSYLIVAKTSKKATDIKAFANVVFGDCQKKATGLGYAPLPASVLAASTKVMAGLAVG